jgi:hypothetical protein
MFISFQTTLTHLNVVSQTIKLNMEEPYTLKQIHSIRTQLVVLFRIIWHTLVEELCIFNSFQPTPTHHTASLKTIKLSSEDHFCSTHTQSILIHRIVFSSKMQQREKVVHYFYTHFQYIQTHLIAFLMKIRLNKVELCKSKQIQYIPVHQIVNSKVIQQKIMAQPYIFLILPSIQTRPIVSFKIIGHNVMEELYILKNSRPIQIPLIAFSKTIKLNKEDHFTFTHIQITPIHPIVHSKTILLHYTEEL